MVVQWLGLPTFTAERPPGPIEGHGAQKILKPSLKLLLQALRLLRASFCAGRVLSPPTVNLSLSWGKDLAGPQLSYLPIPHWDRWGVDARHNTGSFCPEKLSLVALYGHGRAFNWDGCPSD